MADKKYFLAFDLGLKELDLFDFFIFHSFNTTLAEQTFLSPANVHIFCEIICLNTTTNKRNQSFGV